MLNCKASLALVLGLIAFLSPLSVVAWSMMTPIQTPIAMPTQITLIGELVYLDIEGGFYAVDGYRLIGETEQFAAKQGQRVMVVGSPVDDISIYMTKAIKVERLFAPKLLTATTPLPAKIILNDTPVSFGKALPRSEDKTLMLPLRALVDAAGGMVTWSDKTRTATIGLSGRRSNFVVGSQELRLNQNDENVFIAMGKAPKIFSDRLYISADAVSSVLGLLVIESESDNDILTLISPEVQNSYPPNPKEEYDWGIIRGTIEDIKKDGRNILVKGEAMTNGEPLLIWISLNATTRIFWAESKQEASIADLAVSQTIEAALSGPVMESYPAQGGAGTITIID